MHYTLHLIGTVAAANTKYAKPSKAPTFTVKLAKEAFFGDDVLAQCTVYGCRDYPGLPFTELQALKQYTFERLTDYWSNPAEFETLIVLVQSARHAQENAVFVATELLP